MKPLYLFLLATLFVSTGCNAEAPAPDAPAPEAVKVPTATVSAPTTPPDSATARRFRKVMGYARTQRLHERPLGEIMTTVGEQFRGQPYMAGLLDVPGTESLICRLDGFDCVTFVETTLAMARGIAAQDYSYDTFSRHLLEGRYRGGKLEGYCSRLHYFSSWIADNEARGNVHNVTREIGGAPLGKTIDFMTKNRDKYPRFATNDSLYECIAEAEAELADLTLYYVPQNRIRSVYDQLQAGDIIATATDIKGLDVTHTGLVYDAGDGRKGLLHASTSGGVMVSPDLQTYIQNNKKQIGIVVARPVASVR